MCAGARAGGSARRTGCRAVATSRGATAIAGGSAGATARRLQGRRRRRDAAGCAPGPGGYNNIFGNRYGQYLASIQVKREAAAKEAGRTYDPAEDDWNFEQEGEDEDEEGGAAASSAAAGFSASSSSGAAAASAGDGGKRKRAAASDAADSDGAAPEAEGGVKRAKQTET